MPDFSDGFARNQTNYYGKPEVSFYVPAVQNPGSVDAQLWIWITLPDGTHPKFGNPGQSCGGVLQSGSLCCVPSVHNGYECNVPPFSQSGVDFGVNDDAYRGSLQPGTKLYIQLPGESKPRVWKLEE